MIIIAIFELTYMMCLCTSFWWSGLKAFFCERERKIDRKRDRDTMKKRQQERACLQDVNKLLLVWSEGNHLGERERKSVPPRCASPRAPSSRVWRQSFYGVSNPREKESLPPRCASPWAPSGRVWRQSFFAVSNPREKESLPPRCACGRAPGGQVAKQSFSGVSNPRENE